MIVDLLKNKKFYLAIVVILIALLPSLYFYNLYKKNQKILKALPKNVDETRELLDKVGKLIELPKEEATVASVSDKEKLKDQPFFQNAKNGDKVLIFTKAKKAILYRPSINKIIEVGKINLETSSSASTITPTKIVELSSPTVTSTVVNKVRLVIYNGTKVTNLATKEKDLILSTTNNIEVTALGNSKNDYTENLVISLKTGNENGAKQLADLVSGKVVTLPKGETAPADADLLLIIGKE